MSKLTYYTVAMRRSRGLPIKGKFAHLYTTEVSSSAEEVPEWKLWAKVPAGYCACNVPIHQCPDHKSDPRYIHKTTQATPQGKGTWY